MFRGLLVALLLIEGIAWADDAVDPLAQARKAVAASDYTAARGQLASALEAGGHSPGDLAELYRLSGTVYAALGDGKAAAAAFTRLLVLSPKATLPAGTSPKIRRPFDDAVHYMVGREPLELKIETAGKPPAIAIVVVSDPLDMVARARVVFSLDGGAEQTKEIVASERTEVALPQGARIEARVAALDVHGNRLIKLGSKDAPIVILGDPPPVAVRVAPPPPSQVVATAPVEARPLYLQWWPYAAATVALGGATAYFGLSARSATNDLQQIVDDPAHSPAEASAVEDRARRKVLYTNIGLGVTAAFAVTPGVLFVVAPGAHAEVRVTAAPMPGGGALVVGGDF